MDKKETRWIRSLTLLLVIVMMTVSGCQIFRKERASEKRTPLASNTLVNTVPSDTKPTLKMPELPSPSPSVEPTPEATKPAVVLPVANNPDEVEGPIPEGFYENTLFVGDSRTVGMKEYGDAVGATFFCDVGMSVFSLGDTTCSYDDVGTVSLEGLLSCKSFTRVFFMLGINECGYDHGAIVEKYGQWLDMIRSYQPQAQIVLQANMHVGAGRSASDSIINNPNLDSLNERIAKLAEERENTIYIDENKLFDDASGNLGAAYSNDEVHPTAQYYSVWVVWLSRYINYEQ